MTYRTRDIVETEVDTAQGDLIVMKTFVGILPEDMLELLSKQFLVRKIEGISLWTGPDEKIQQLLTGSISSSKRRT